MKKSNHQGILFERILVLKIGTTLCNRSIRMMIYRNFAFEVQWETV